MTQQRLAPGDHAPSFRLVSATGDEVSLADYAGRSLVLYFYPSAMTPGCTRQAVDFRDALEPLRDAGYAVVGVSPDDPARLARFAERDGLTFPLLSDPEHVAAEAYGAWGEKTSYGRTSVGLIRSTIVVDPAGIVTLARYNVRATGHVASLTKALGVTLPD